MKTRGEGGDREEYTEVDGVRVKVGTGELPYFKDVFEPGTMMPKEGLTTTRDGIRKYVGTFCYNKAMITEEFLDHLMELSKKWNDLYMAYKGKEYWKNRGLEGHHDDYYIDGVHLRDKVKEIKVPTLVIWGRNSNKGVDAGFQLYKRIPNAQMHIFDKANHFLWLDQVEDFNSLVTWYLTQEGGSVE
jgi:pimeloyl-ACP methyl ester carboxylesterase